MPIDDKLRKQAETAFTRARIYLMNHRPFYSYLTLKLRLEWLEDVPGGLSCTDGEALYINPVEFVKLDKMVQVTVLVHEVLHCACGHLWRRGGRDPHKWNVAADIAIDNILHADQFADVEPWRSRLEKGLKKHGLSYAMFAGQPAENIYPRLPDSPPQNCGCGAGDVGSCFRDQSGQDTAKRSEAEATWKANVVAAGQLAGNTPGAWSELVKAAMPKPPFHLKLFEYLNRGLGGDTDWASLNRRHMWRGIYLPTETRTVMGRVAWVIDSSGSMSRGEPMAQLNRACGYFRGFRDQHPCVADLMFCDCGTPTHKTYEEWEPLPETFKASGGGGTSFNPPFELLREKRIEPRVLVYCTDAYGSCTVARPSYPVLWLIIGGDRDWKAPFGEVINVSV